MTARDWWRKPRRISVVVDNPSWIVPFAERLVDDLAAAGDEAKLVRSHSEIQDGAVAFYLGCIKVTPPDVLARNRRNLVVHASPLPKGRGFSPLTWQVLEGLNEIPICLIEAEQEVDSGSIIYREAMHLAGHELIGEMHQMMGEKTRQLCRRFMAEATPPRGLPQQGAATHYARRRPPDSRLDPDKTITEQFDLLRTVDNDAYPAFFELRGQRYKLTIEKFPETKISK